MRIYAYTYKRMNDLHKVFSSWVHWIYDYIYMCMHSMWLIFVDVRDQNHIEYLLFYYILHVWWISTGGLTKILWTTSTISYLAWIISAFQQGEDINHRPPSPSEHIHGSGLACWNVKFASRNIDGKAPRRMLALRSGQSRQGDGDTARLAGPVTGTPSNHQPMKEGDLSNPYIVTRKKIEQYFQAGSSMMFSPFFTIISCNIYIYTHCIFNCNFQVSSSFLSFSRWSYIAYLMLEGNFPDGDPEKFGAKLAGAIPSAISQDQRLRARSQA
jgi:hypothetical protein